MCRVAWIKKRFEASVAQGIGSWMESSEDPDLGKGIFVLEGNSTVQVFEDGFTYDGSLYLKLRYDQMTDIELLDLRSLMKVQKTPSQLIEFTVLTANERHVLRIPLMLYTTLSAMLNGILRMRSSLHDPNKDL